MDMRWEGIWTVQHIRNGEVIWEDTGHNALAQQGEEAVLETFFRGDATYTPAQYYVRLCNDSLLVTDTLTTILNEPVGSGYVAQLLERSAVGFPTKEIDAGAYRIVSKVLSFTAAGGAIGPVTTAYLATSIDNTGKLIAYRPLVMTRTILDGDTMTINFRIKVS